MNKSDLGNGNIIFFDGICNLCNHFISLVVQKDQTRQFKIASLQGKTAAQMLEANDIKELQSVILWTEKRVLRGPAAIQQILKSLGQDSGSMKSLSLLFNLLPLFLQNWGYQQVAQNRYALFGKKSSCRLPTPEERAYFLD